MNILIFSNNSWDDRNSIGNTLSNFFDGEIWNKDTFYNIYMRDSMPDNRICNNYYKLTLLDMIKNNFNKNRIGKEFAINRKSSLANNYKEQKYIDIIHKHSLSFVYSLADIFYRKKKWLNNSFKEYISKSNPDIFFAFIANISMLQLIVEYVKKNTNAKIVLFAADDVYGSYDTKSYFRKKRLKKEFKKTIQNADKIYAITDELRIKYENIFNRKIDYLCKGCIFDYQVKEKINEQIKFVYAGNLLYGRDELLSIVAKAIKKSNDVNKQQAILEIYTGSTITEELEKKLNIKNSSIIMGNRNYDEIKKIMNNADFNLHVESFKQSQINVVKYSFSTKIIDCLQSGSSFIGIGPSSISSIKYIKKVPGAYYIDSIDDIEKQIKYLINNKNSILTSAKKIRDYALEKNNVKINRQKIRNDFIMLMGKKE